MNAQTDRPVGLWAMLKARPTYEWAILLGAILAIALFALIATRMSGDDEAQGDAADAATISELPATPEEMETRGEAALTVLPPDDARAKNEAVPFAEGRPTVAKPFDFNGSNADRMRAVECLAAAVLYEAGDDRKGQEAVAQVVLNRVRHRAFPASVCSVVYQGSQRRTGCQFTFTCDGSLARRMPEAMWSRARTVARRALGGFVDPTVGLATHYHTNWVYPYWSPSLSKLAQVGTHLFFGWPGSWGGPLAFNQRHSGKEVSGGIEAPGAQDTLETEGTLATVDPDAPKILGLPQPKAELPEGMGTVPLYGNRLRLVGSDDRSFGLLAPSGATAARLVNAALALCKEPGPCRVNAWANEDDIPGTFPIPSGARSTMVFEYVRGGSEGSGAPRFDCERFPNKDPARCLSPRLDPGEILSGARFKE